MDGDAPEYEAIERAECPHCRRLFAVDRLERHVGVCLRRPARAPRPAPKATQPVLTTAAPVRRAAGPARAPARQAFVGLANQGGTCYLNSLLQALFHTARFRRAIYGVDTAGHGESSIVLQLQRLFASLERGHRRVVTTKALTRAFGWTERDAFEQHDVQELCRVLFDALDQSMPGSGLIDELYQGQLDGELKCHECDTGRHQSEPFLDIQLDIQGPIDSLESALAAFFRPAVLDDPVTCERCDKRTATSKGYALTKLPSDVLMVTLKRFTYDPTTWRRVKINKRVSLPFELDLGAYVPGAAPLELFGVMVHSGSAFGGHYHAMIRAGGDDFFDFNDSSVTPVTRQEVLDAAEGDDGYASSNAYMLLYRSKAAPPQAADPAPKLPAHIVRHVEADNEAFAADLERLERERNTVRFGIVVEAGEAPRAVVTLTRQESLAGLVEAAYAAAELDCGLDCIRLRALDGMRRPAAPLSADELALPVREYVGAAARVDLFLEQRAADGAFSDYQPGQLRFTLVRMDAAGAFVVVAREMGVDASSCTLGGLREQIAAATGIPAERQLVLAEQSGAACDSSSGPRVTDTVKQYLPRAGADSKDEALVRAELHVELALHLVLFVEDAPESGDSSLVRFVDDKTNTVVLKYNGAPGERTFDCEIAVDRRQPLRAIKARLAEAVDVPVDELVMRIGAQEMKNLEPSLKEAAGSASTVFLERGVPLKPGEFHCRVFLGGRLDAALPAAASASLVVREDQLISELRGIVAPMLGDDLAPELLRLRRKAGRGMGRVFHSSRTIKECIHTRTDVLEMAAQRLDAPEDIGDHETVFLVRRYLPQTAALGPARELVVDASKTIADLRDLAAAATEIEPFDQCAIVKPWAFQLQDAAALARLTWTRDAGSSSFRVGKYVKDGDTLLTRDEREVGDDDLEREDQAAAAGPLAPPPPPPLGAGRVERGIKIRVDKDATAA